MWGYVWRVGGQSLGLDQRYLWFVSAGFGNGRVGGPPVINITFPARSGMSFSGLKETPEKLSIP